MSIPRDNAQPGAIMVFVICIIILNTVLFKSSKEFLFQKLKLLY